MDKSFNKMLQGYQLFQEKYASGDNSIMKYLSHYGQQPKAMFVSCCDSRVDPALILQCDPGDLFVVRNVANIIPPYEKDIMHHGTSAALEFGICFLNIKQLILLGHSQCGGIQALINKNNFSENDFILNWVSLIDDNKTKINDTDEYAKHALHQSYQNCLTFPWIKERLKSNDLSINLWFFDVKQGQVYQYSESKKNYVPLTISEE